MELSNLQKRLLDLMKACGISKSDTILFMLTLKDDESAMVGLSQWLSNDFHTSSEVKEALHLTMEILKTDSNKQKQIPNKEVNIIDLTKIASKLSNKLFSRLLDFVGDMVAHGYKTAKDNDEIDDWKDSMLCEYGRELEDSFQLHEDEIHELIDDILEVNYKARGREMPIKDWIKHYYNKNHQKVVRVTWTLLHDTVNYPAEVWLDIPVHKFHGDPSITYEGTWKQLIYQVEDVEEGEPVDPEWERQTEEWASSVANALEEQLDEANKEIEERNKENPDDEQEDKYPLVEIDRDAEYSPMEYDNLWEIMREIVDPSPPPIWD